MHEYSIVQNLLDLCEQNAHTHNCTKITKVVIKIGRLSNIEPALLKTAFDTFKDETIASNSELEIIDQKVVVKCKNCNSISEPPEHDYCCQTCESYEVTVIEGDELLLMSLEMDE